MRAVLRCLSRIEVVAVVGGGTRRDEVVRCRVGRRALRVGSRRDLRIGCSQQCKVQKGSARRGDLELGGVEATFDEKALPPYRSSLYRSRSSAILRESKFDGR